MGGSTTAMSGDDVKQHPFFTQALGAELNEPNFSFTNLATIRAPYIPPVKSHSSSRPVKLSSYKNNKAANITSAVPDNFEYSQDQPSGRVNATMLLTAAPGVME